MTQRFLRHTMWTVALLAVVAGAAFLTGFENVVANALLALRALLRVHTSVEPRKPAGNVTPFSVAGIGWGLKSGSE